MKKAFERNLIKRLPVKDLKLNVNEKDLYVVALISSNFTEEEKLYLAYEIHYEIITNEKYLRRLNVNYIASISIKETEEEYNEEVEYNEYNCDGGMYYEI